MSTAVLTNRLELNSVADTALKAATRFWFVVAFIGQLVFAFTLASFYGLTALRGDFHGWSRFITHGYVTGDTMGNLAVADCHKPKLIIQGTADELAPYELAVKWFDQVPAPKSLVAIEDADHFFQGHMDEVQAVIVDFVQTLLD